MEQFTKEQIEAMIKAMSEIANVAHSGQFRRDEKTPYIKHIEDVTSRVEDRLKPIALGHDLIEDTNITLQDLINAGFPKYVTDGIKLLTHENNEPNVIYWKRIAGNKDVAEVKLADIDANLSDAPSQKQMKKYKKALDLFAKDGYDVSKILDKHFKSDIVNANS